MSITREWTGGGDRRHTRLWLSQKGLKGGGVGAGPSSRSTTSMSACAPLPVLSFSNSPVTSFPGKRGFRLEAFPPSLLFFFVGLLRLQRSFGKERQMMHARSANRKERKDDEEQRGRATQLVEDIPLTHHQQLGRPSRGGQTAGDIGVTSAEKDQLTVLAGLKRGRGVHTKSGQAISLGSCQTPFRRRH